MNSFLGNVKNRKFEAGYIVSCVDKIAFLSC